MSAVKIAAVAAVVLAGAAGTVVGVRAHQQRVAAEQAAVVQAAMEMAEAEAAAQAAAEQAAAAQESMEMAEAQAMQEMQETDAPAGDKAVAPEQQQAAEGEDQSIADSPDIDPRLFGLYDGTVLACDETDWVIVMGDWKEDPGGYTRTMDFHLILPADKLRDKERDYLFEPVLDGEYLVMFREAWDDLTPVSLTIADDCRLSVQWADGDFPNFTLTDESSIVDGLPLFELFFAPVDGYYHAVSSGDPAETGASASDSQLDGLWKTIGGYPYNTYYEFS